MSSGIGRELFGGIQSGVQEMVQERIDDEISRIQVMDITRAAAALLDANERYNRKSGLRSWFFVWKVCALFMEMPRTQT